MNTAPLSTTSPAGRRPRRPVTVVVPFSGSQQEADELCDSLGGLELREGDEIILVDNSPKPLRDHGRPVQRVRAIEERCSYYARNVGAAASRNDWVLFMDADCRPQHAQLLDRFFDPWPAERCAAVAGGIIDAVGQESLLARHARSRRYLDQAGALSRARPFALTAHLLVSRAAWQAIGGFCETIRSGGDQDFSWRLEDAGWSIELRDSAVVGHLHQERLRPALRKFVRYGAGAAWLDRRHPSRSSLRPPLIRGVARAVVGGVVWTLVRRPERAAFKVIDGLIILAVNLGYLLENRPPTPPDPVVPPHDGPVLIADEAPSSTLANDFARAKRIEALRRAAAPRADAVRRAPVVFSEDDGHGRRALDLAWLALRRPARVAIEAARDLRHRSDGPSVRDLACMARRTLTLDTDPRLVARGPQAVATAQRLSSLAGARNGTSAEAANALACR